VVLVIPAARGENDAAKPADKVAKKKTSAGSD
jgi:hypothetical protein